MDRGCPATNFATSFSSISGWVGGTVLCPITELRERIVVVSRSNPSRTAAGGRRVITRPTTP